MKPDEFRDTPLLQWATRTTEGVSLRMWNSGRGLYAFIRDVNGGDHNISVDSQFQTGVWQHVAQLSAHLSKLSGHVKSHVPALQIGVEPAGTGHALPQLPQCATVVRMLVSQPFDLSSSQLSQPVSHDPV